MSRIEQEEEEDEEDFFGDNLAQYQGSSSDPIVSQEYNRLQSRYTDAGYREGITDGKLSTLQEGFDSAFASSVPFARRIGQLRGQVAGIVGYLQTQSSSSSTTTSSFSSTSSLPATTTDPFTSSSSSSSKKQLFSLLEEAKEISSSLGRVKRDDILPIDQERIAHEHEAHRGGNTGTGTDGQENEGYGLDWTEKREMERLESALEMMGGGGKGKNNAIDLDLVERQLKDLEKRVWES